MKFIEEEAELGSDDEENDDNVKRINREDDEEDEDGLDEDLKDFVVHPGDDEDIGDADQNMIEKHNRDMAELDRLENQKIVDAILFGNNRKYNNKRKRNEVDGEFEDDNDFERRKHALMVERFGENYMENLDDLKLEGYGSKER